MTTDPKADADAVRELLARMVELAPFTSFLSAYADEWQDLMARAALASTATAQPSAAPQAEPETTEVDEAQLQRLMANGAKAWAGHGEQAAPQSEAVAMLEVLPFLRVADEWPEVVVADVLDWEFFKANRPGRMAVYATPPRSGEQAAQTSGALTDWQIFSSARNHNIFEEPAPDDVIAFAREILASIPPAAGSETA